VILTLRSRRRRRLEGRGPGRPILRDHRCRGLLRM